MNGRVFDVCGAASFSSTGEAEHLYAESGTMIERKTGYEPTIKDLSVSKRYWYRYDDQRDEIGIYFDDRDGSKDRLFHTMKVRAGGQGKETVGSGSHRCGSDVYHVEYVFGEPLSIEYRVSGPNKEYTSRTNFTRI